MEHRENEAGDAREASSQGMVVAAAAEPVGRRELAALVGALAGLAATGCLNDAGGEAPLEDLGRSAEAVMTTGTALAWVDTVLGAVPTVPPTPPPGDLATKNSANIGNANIVFAKGCVTIGDGGGGLFYWDDTSATGDNGGTVIVPTAGGGRWRRIFSGEMNVRWFGAVGNGVSTSNDTPAIQRAITACAGAPGVVFFPPGRYRITSTLTVPSYVTLAGAGMGLTTFHMPVASFTNTTTGSAKYNGTSVAIDCSGQTSSLLTPTIKITLRDFTIESDTNDGRHLYPILARNSRQLQILRVEVMGIPAGNMITLDSVVIGEIAHCFLHDGTSSSASSVQLTGIETDGNRVGDPAKNCIAVEIHHNTIVSLTFTGAALRGSNMNTDGINTGLGSSHGLSIHDNHIQNVGEGVDCFSSESTIHGNVLADCNNVGVKLIHGASRNHIYGNTIMYPGLAGLYIVGGGNGNGNGTNDNYFHNNLIHNVDPKNIWASNTPSGIYIDGGTAFTANNNTFRDNKITGGAANMDYAIRQDEGTNNRFYDNEAESWTIAYSNVAVGTAQITNAKKTQVRAYVGSDQPTSSGMEVTVNYNTEEMGTDAQGEFNASTKVYTANSHRRLRVFAAARFPAAVLGDTFQLKIRKNGSDRTLSKQIVPLTSEFTLTVSDTFAVVPGDTVEIRFVQTSSPPGTRTITGNSLGLLSYLTIEEVAS